MVTLEGVDERPPLLIDTDANCAVRRFLSYRSAISRVQLVTLEFAARATTIKTVFNELLKRSFVARYKMTLLAQVSIRDKAMYVKCSCDICDRSGVCSHGIDVINA
jgi:hypothetical protein